MSGITKQQRQFNLILTLVSHPSGLLRDEILSIVPGYSENFKRYSNRDQSNILKQFERDKRDIRDLGIVIETVDEFDALDDNQNTRYFISESNYVFPPGTAFSVSEQNLLRAAAQAWRVGSLNLEARHALTKLRGMGIPGDESLIGLAPHLDKEDEFLEILQDAQNNRTIVSFAYLKPATVDAVNRRVSPLAFVDIYGQWHMYAFDHDASDFRTFLPARIVAKPVAVAGDYYQDSTRDFAQDLLSELVELYERQRAEIVADRPLDHSWTRVETDRETEGGYVWQVNYTDLDSLADSLCFFMDEFDVVSPRELQEKIKNKLRLIAQSHGQS